MAIVKISINLCRFIQYIRGSDIAAKWSAIVILGLTFTPSLRNITTFTMTLPSKPHCSTSYNQRSLPSSLLVVMYYIYMLLPWFYPPGLNQLTVDMREIYSRVPENIFPNSRFSVQTPDSLLNQLLDSREVNNVVRNLSMFLLDRRWRVENEYDEMISQLMSPFGFRFRLEFF